MIFHDYYADIPADVVEAFVASQLLARLVTVGEDGTPHIGLYPFVRDGKAFELHVVRTDEIAVDLKTRPRCVIEVDEVLAAVPSYWVSAEYGGAATAYHRTVIFECIGSIVEDPDRVAAQQRRLLARYQPEGGCRDVRAGDPLYRGAIGMLAAVRLEPQRVKTKFKLGQNRDESMRRKIIAKLRERGRPEDLRAAEALEWTLSAPEDKP